MHQDPIEFLRSFMEQNRYFIGNDLLIAFIKAQQIHEHQVKTAYIESNSYQSAEQYFNEKFNR
jgi:hypothetical protein